MEDSSNLHLKDCDSVQMMDDAQPPYDPTKQ